MLKKNLYDDDVLIITAYQMNCSSEELMLLYHLFFFFKNNVPVAFKSGGYISGSLAELKMILAIVSKILDKDNLIVRSLLKLFLIKIF